MATILVIDEYDAFRETMEFCLPKFGHSVRTASTVAEAANWADHTVEVVLLDIGLPRLTGIQSCETLKRDWVLGRVPVVILTGQLTPEIVTRAMAVGADEMLPKPFLWPHLLETIARLTARQNV